MRAPGKKRRKFSSPLSTSENREVNANLWMVPYADLMSNLMILFLALFAFSYISRSAEFDNAMSKIEKEMSTKEAEEAAAARLRDTQMAVDIKEEMKKLALRDFGVRVTSSHIHLTLPAPVLFREGSVRLSPGARKVLGALALLIGKTENPVLVSGHTDNLPIIGGRHKTNWELSAARAFSVIEFFADSGLPAARFFARGYGEFRPVDSNETEAGRRRNRRIEIRLVREIRREE